MITPFIKTSARVESKVTRKKVAPVFRDGIAGVFGPLKVDQ